MMASCLFIGFRKKAVAAALELGLDKIVIWDEAAHRFRTEERRLTWIQSPFPTPRVRGEHIRERLAGLAPRWVVPLTERSVVPAAVIRKALGLSGSSLELAVRCHDKVAMKAHGRRAGLPMTDFLVTSKKSTAEQLVARWGLPIVLKEKSLSGGRGLTVARSMAELRRALREDLIAERYVDADEMSIESYVEDGIVRFQNPTEYFEKRVSSVVPATHRPAEIRLAKELSNRVIESFAIDRGMVHLEVYLTEDGPLFGELALRPPGGYLMDLISIAYGFDSWKAYVSVCCSMDFHFPSVALRTAAAWMMHPGPGIVSSVEGQRACCEDPAVAEVNVKVGPGDTIERRQGAGEHVGHVLMKGASRSDILEALARVRTLMKFKMDS